MKTFEHAWDAEIFLLHLQLGKPEGRAFEARLVRNFRDGETREETVPVRPQGTSHRFLVTRTHPRETGFAFRYPADVALEVFLLDDRAYYPTESFYKG